MSDFSGNALHTLFNSTMEAEGLKMGQVMPLLRMALSGTMSGPPVFDIADVLGKESVQERLKLALERFPTYA